MGAEQDASRRRMPTRMKRKEKLTQYYRVCPFFVCPFGLNVLYRARFRISSKALPITISDSNGDEVVHDHFERLDLIDSSTSRTSCIYLCIQKNSYIRM